jgi:hypothetical protein
MGIQGARTEVIVKRFNCPKWLDPLRATLHHGPALRAWHTGHGLLVRHIPTARPLAVIERVRGALVRESYLITEAIPSSLPLNDYLHEVVDLLPDHLRERRTRWLAGRLGGLVGKMHQRFISHRDMKAINFLVTPASAAVDQPDLYLIDLAGVQIWRRLPAIRRYQNLARILVSLESHLPVRRSDILRFLRAYQPGGSRDRSEWKVLWREVMKLAARKIAKNRKSHRPIT